MISPPRCNIPITKQTSASLVQSCSLPSGCLKLVSAVNFTSVATAILHNLTLSPSTAMICHCKMTHFTRVCSIYAAVFALCSVVNSQAPIGVIAPAETTVSNALVTLLPAEALQFTDSVFDRIANDDSTSDIADVFAFDSNSTLDRRQFSNCKTYPGDNLWPSKLVWNFFDLLLGRRLLATEPIASPCYDSIWGSKNLAECNALVNRFTKATTQCVD
jgi:hypothetical protein